MDIFSTKTSYQEYVGPRSLSGGASRRSFRNIPWKTLKNNTFCEKNPFILVVNFLGCSRDIWIYMYAFIYIYICFHRGMLERCFRNTGDQKLKRSRRALWRELITVKGRPSRKLDMSRSLGKSGEQGETIIGFLFLAYFHGLCQF